METARWQKMAELGKGFLSLSRAGLLAQGTDGSEELPQVVLI